MEEQDVCAIVVTLNPQADFSENIERLSCQVGHILIVDNGSSAESLDRIRSIADEFGASLIVNFVNLGISKALNLGIEFGKQRGWRWLATFDQDSLATDGMIGKMLSCCRGEQNSGKIGVVAPILVEPAEASKDANARSECCCKEARTAITSGSLFPIDVFESCGLFEERYFIDYVDHEFCLRLRRHGFRVIQCQHAVLVHSLGRRTYHQIAGIKVSVTNHNPVRRYYNARNRLLTYKRYMLDELTWSLHDFRAFGKEIIKLILFEDDRLQKVRAVIKGICHGLIGRGGPYA